MKFIPFAIPDITHREKEAVLKVLDSNWITTGNESKAFEDIFRKTVGCEHAIAVNSCTAAMHLALEAVGIGPGDEVIVPTMTFAATGEVVRYLGAKPVLVDIDAKHHNISTAQIERAITPKTKAIIPVHYAGQSCEIDDIVKLAHNNGLKVIEDAAHAFPASYKGASIGSHGDIVCYSFYATKTITTGEGGMAVTNNEEWADRMRVMSLHGISKDAWKRYTAEGSWYYEIVAPGFKYNMTDIAAAMGLVQTDRADEMLHKRRAIAKEYLEAFRDEVTIEPLEIRSFDDHAWHLFVIRLVNETLSIERNRFIEELKDMGIGTSVHFIPLHLHPYYRETYGYMPHDFPVALDCYERSVSLPIYSKMSSKDTQRVISSVKKLTNKYRRL